MKNFQKSTNDTNAQIMTLSEKNIVDEKLTSALVASLSFLILFSKSKKFFFEQSGRITSDKSGSAVAGALVFDCVISRCLQSFHYFHVLPHLFKYGKYAFQHFYKTFGTRCIVMILHAKGLIVGE